MKQSRPIAPVNICMAWNSDLYYFEIDCLFLVKISQHWTVSLRFFYFCYSPISFNVTFEILYTALLLRFDC